MHCDTAIRTLCWEAKAHQLPQAEEAVLQSTDYAATIRRTFQYDGLQGAVESLPLEKRFKLASVKDVRPPH